MSDLDIHHVAAILYGGEYERRHAEPYDHDDADADAERYDRAMHGPIYAEGGEPVERAQ